MEQLPPELLLQILRFLPGHCLLKQIPSVSKAFHEAVSRHEDVLFEPLVRRAVSEDEDPSAILQSRCRGSWKTVYKLLCAPVLIHSCSSVGNGSSIGFVKTQWNISVRISGYVVMKVWSSRHFRGMTAARIENSRKCSFLNSTSLNELKKSVITPLKLNYRTVPRAAPLIRQGKPQLHVGPEEDFVILEGKRKKLGVEATRINEAVRTFLESMISCGNHF